MDSLDEFKEKLERIKKKMEIPNWQETIGDEIDSELDEFTTLFSMAQPKIELNVKKLHPDAVLPKYNYDGDSGFDFHSTEEVTIGPFGRALIPTGLAFDLPAGHELQIRSKSGLAINQGLMVLNSPATIDQGYTSEVKVVLFNTNGHDVVIKKGMKVGQGVLAPAICGGYVSVSEVDVINEKTRGSNGFGSTGLV
jgi:dUTP pyrophosphatase